MLDPRMAEEPELMLPGNIPEEVFDILFIESHALLNSVDGSNVIHLALDELTNIVVDILRIYDLYDLYKDNVGGLLVMYASWIILESLRRSEEIDMKACSFEMLFNNEVLMQALSTHHEAFEKTIQTINVKS